MQRILDKLEASQSLYVVPPDTRSSRFWLYATLYEGRRTPAMVVSNDSLLEHRALFPDIRSFQRWRAQHLVTYKFTRRAMPAHKRPRNYQPPVLTLNAPGTRILSIVHINALTVTHALLCVQRNCHAKCSATKTAGTSQPWIAMCGSA